MPRFLDTTDEPTYGVGICDRCKFKFPLAALHLDPNTSLRVCRDDLDVLDPYRLPPREPDRIDLPFYRLDTPMTFEEDATVTGGGGESVVGEAVVGEAIVGGEEA